MTWMVLRFPTYVGNSRQNPTPQGHEGITSLAAAMGATLAGVDKSDQDGRNYLSMFSISYRGKLSVPAGRH